MVNLLLSIAGIILTIFLVVGVHEFGHFICARLLGVKVLRFSIGFGKVLYQWHDQKGTQYVISAIPLGGYVKLLDEREEPVNSNELHLAYNQQPYYKKFAIVAAGPLINLIFAFLIYWLIFLIGFTSVIPVIGEVLPHSIAAEAGLKPHQEIVQIDKKEIRSWMSVVMALLLHAGEKDELTIQTKPLDGHSLETHVLNLRQWHLDELKPDPLASLGIVPFKPELQWPKDLLRKNQYSFFPAFIEAWKESRELIQLNFILIGKLVTGKVSLQSLGGPITIFESAGNAFLQGLIPFLAFLAFLNISIGLVNILPIPGLDGGHLFIEFIEFIIRKPLPLTFQLLLYRLGIIILLLLITQTLINDVLRLR